MPGLEVGATLHGPVEHGVEGNGGPLRGWTALYLDQLGCLLKMITMTDIFVFLMLHDRTRCGKGMEGRSCTGPLFTLISGLFSET